MLEEFESMSHEHLGRISVSKLQIDHPNDEVWSISSVLYQAKPTARQFAAAEISQMFTENVIEPATTVWATPIVFHGKKNGSQRFCVDYRKLNDLILLNW